jgi:hypothetical protein
MMNIKKIAYILIVFWGMTAMQFSSAAERYDDISDNKSINKEVLRAESERQYFLTLSCFSEPLKKFSHHSIRSIAVVMPDGTEYESERWDRGKKLLFRKYGIDSFGVQLSITKQMFPLSLKIWPLSNKAYIDCSHLTSTSIKGWVPWGDNMQVFEIQESDIFDEVGNQVITGILIHTSTIEWKDTTLRLVFPDE